MRSPKMECVVTNHQWLENDSLFADLVLPVSCAAEEDDVVGSGMCVSVNWAGIQKRACEPVGESKSDYEIAVEMAKQFGLDDEMTQGMECRGMAEILPLTLQTSRTISAGRSSQRRDTSIPSFDPDWQNDPARYESNSTTILKIIPWTRPRARSSSTRRHWPITSRMTRNDGPIAKWVIGGPESEGWTHDETQWGEKAKTYPLLLVQAPGGGASMSRATISPGSGKSRPARSRAMTAICTSRCGSTRSMPRSAESNTATSSRCTMTRVLSSVGRIFPSGCYPEPSSSTRGQESTRSPSASTGEDRRT